MKKFKFDLSINREKKKSKKTKEEKISKKVVPAGKFKLMDNLDIPNSVVFGMPMITMNGNREIIVEGVKGIMEYEENIIKLNGGKIQVKITGIDLDLKNMLSTSCIVRGTISSVEFI